jgi:hypothetical protein
VCSPSSATLNNEAQSRLHVSALLCMCCNRAAKGVELRLGDALKAFEQQVGSEEQCSVQRAVVCSTSSAISEEWRALKTVAGGALEPLYAPVTCDMPAGVRQRPGGAYCKRQSSAS